MKFENFTIEATASAVPKRVVTNDQLAQIMETSDEWIVQRTGIHQRHISTDETTTQLCTQVAQTLLAKANLTADDLDYIVVATMSPDTLTPSVSAGVQGNLGAQHAAAFDLNAACSGFVYGLSVVRQLLIGDRQKHALLIGGEVLSRLIDWQDRSTAVLFGDGAAGVLLSSAPAAEGAWISEDIRTFGDLGDHLTAGQLPSHDPFTGQTSAGQPYFQMNGRQIYSFAVKQIPQSIERAVKQSHLIVNDINHFVLHQANQRIIQAVANKMAVESALFPVNIGEMGNTAAASEPLLLDQLVTDGTIQRGDLLALTGFGGGLTVGTVLLRY